MNPTTSFKTAKAGMRAALAAAPMVMAAVLAVGMHEAKADSVVATYGTGWASGGKQYSSSNEVGRAANAYEGLRDRLSGARVGNVISKVFQTDEPESDKAKEAESKDDAAKKTSTYGETAKSGSVGVARATQGYIDYTKPYRPGAR